MLVLTGFSPFGVQHAGDVERYVRFSASALLLIDGLLAIVCALNWDDLLGGRPSTGRPA